MVLTAATINLLDGWLSQVKLTKGYIGLTGSIAVNVCVCSAGIGHVMPWPLQTSGLSMGKGTSTPSMIP